VTPFTDNPEDQVVTIGEVELIRRITEWMEPVSPPPPFGIGDDCAVMDSGDVGTMLLTVDALVWNEHFDETFSPEEAGAKLVKRNLSDIAAMGGAPAGAVIALTLSDDVSANWLEGFYAGIRECAQFWGFLIVGGDITRNGANHCFAAHLTLMGSAQRAIRRNGGQQAGDFVFVTGELGGTRHNKEKTFTPRLPEGQWLAQQSVIRAMIDVTDGLAKDLPALLTPGTCAQLDLAKIPISDAARQLAETNGRPALEHALCDGEDYELLFILSGDIDPELLASEWARSHDTTLTLIGKIAATATAEHERRIVDASSGMVIESAAFQHFRR